MKIINILFYGSDWMAYHTWVHGPGSYRGMSVSPLAWDKNGPHLRWNSAN